MMEPMFLQALFLSYYSMKILVFRISLDTKYLLCANINLGGTTAIFLSAIKQLY